MESNDLLVTLGVSSYESDLRGNWVENFEPTQGIELFKSKMDDFCVFNTYLGIWKKILNTTAADKVRFDLCNVNSLFLGTSWGSSSLRSTHASWFSPVRYEGKWILIESLSQIDSKITACCYFMPPIKIGLYQAWLAAGANRKIAPCRIVLWKIFVQLQWFIYSVSFLLFLFSTAITAKR